MRSATVVALLLVVAFAGCPSSTTGKLVLVNNSSHTISTLNARNLDGDYMVQLAVPAKPETHIAPGETKTFTIAAEGYYSVYASGGGQTWYYGDSIYFSPGVTVTWTITGGKDDGWIEYSDSAATADTEAVPSM